MRKCPCPCAFSAAASAGLQSLDQSPLPLVTRKAYGRRAGLISLLVTLVALTAVLAPPTLGLLQDTFPVMVVLGPLMLLQYVWWRRHCGRERTTWQYLQAESGSANEKV